jgi:NAD(P)H-dependent FMN reductase
MKIIGINGSPRKGSMLDEAARKKRRQEVFPKDKKRAFDMGAELVR